MQVGDKARYHGDDDRLRGRTGTIRKVCIGSCQVDFGPRNENWMVPTGHLRVLPETIGEAVGVKAAPHDYGTLDTAHDPCGTCGVIRGRHGPDIGHLWSAGAQVGGEHYRKCAIDPFKYGMENKLDPLQFSVVKYVTRFRDKNGMEDLKKARHALDLLIAHEEKNVRV